MSRHPSPSPPSSLGSMGSARPISALESSLGIRRKPVPASHGRSPSADAEVGPKPLLTLEATAADEIEASPAKDRRKTANFFSLWKWEFISLLTSILSFFAIIITLLVYQKRLLTEWKLPISINAVIAILSALFKGTLAIPVTEGISQLKWLWFSHQPRHLVDMDLYDKASRGAWGSVLMIFKQFRRGPKSVLASFGALLALVALAVDPFSQASVTSKPCWRAVDKVAATIPRANNYNAFGVHSGAGGTGQTIDPAMNLAAYIGVLKPPANTSVSVPVSCRTNNCTFPSDEGATFSSLGLRVLSWDITDQVVDLGTADGKGWNYTLSWGINLQLGQLLGVTSIMTPGTSFLPEGEGPWNRTSFVDVQLLGLKFKNASCEYPQCDFYGNGDVEPVAFMFSLLPCVQTFAANFTDGVYTEKLIDEQDLHLVSDMAGYQLALNRTIHNGRWMDCEGTDKQTDTNSVKVYSLAAQTNPNPPDYLPVEAWYRPECVYSIRQGASHAIAYLLGPGEFFASEEGLSFGGPQLLNGKIWLQTLWNKGRMSLESVTGFAEGLARTVSAQLRVNPSDGDEAMRAARGVTWEKETCIVFEWRWLTFLASLLVLEIIFFVAVVVVNSRSRWGADWKSSTLAVAYQNVGSATSKEGMGEIPEPELDKYLREAAKTTKVTFTDVDGRWQLRKEEEV
ncbi:hypothetical protein NLG97_g4409 [Lecanicillium saksenae]|uniref:Uncharacterized protein n=1 Tax=Lecanicillium saksenae TaxID=468837 RepID=A0ACC1QZ96_9HYPO|nr:hypothetical protein NLG97_g4409 [Lecanicillium saksenae]